MTATELHEQLEPRLRRQPFVPIRLDGDSGPILFVDNPYRVDLFEGTLTLLHKESGCLPHVVIQADQVKEVFSFDELPAKPEGVSRGELSLILQISLVIKPFYPFEIVLFDGTRFVCDLPGQLNLGEHHGVYDGRNGEGLKSFPFSSVTRVRGLLPPSIS